MSIEKSFMVSIFISLLVVSCFSTDKSSLTSSPFKMHPLSILQGSTDDDETYISVISSKEFYPLRYSVVLVSDSSSRFDSGTDGEKIDGENAGVEKIDGEKIDGENAGVEKTDGEKIDGESADRKSADRKSADGENVNPASLEVLRSIWSPKSMRVIDHVHVSDLALGRLYKLVIKFEGHVIDERTFQAFNANKKRPRIGVVSCMDDRFTEGAKKMWFSYLNKFVDINLFIGDNVYADFDGLKYVKETSVDQLWRRYLETFDKLYIYHSSDLKPTLALWDDHDYGVNNGGASYKNKNQSLQLFNSFFPRYEVEGFKTTKFGAGSYLEAYGQNFIFLDGRFYREVGKEAGTQLGEGQFSYLEKRLREAKKPVWLIKGDQFFGGYHPFESYERQHPKEFKRLIRQVEKVKVPVLFLSGDRHLTEIIKIKKPEFGFNSYEITSSGMHAKVVFKGSLDKLSNPRQLVGKSGVYNYSVIEIIDDKKYKVTAYGEKNWSHYSRELTF